MSINEKAFILLADGRLDCLPVLFETLSRDENDFDLLT